MKKIITILYIFGLLVTIVWFISKRELEPLSGIFILIANLLGLYAGDKIINKNRAIIFGKKSSIKQLNKSTINKGGNENKGLIIGNKNTIEQKNG